MGNVRIDDELTDLSWLVKINNVQNKQRQTTSNSSSSTTMKNKPLILLECQTMTNTCPSLTSHFQHQHEYCHDDKRLFSSSTEFNHSTLKRKNNTMNTCKTSKRFQSEENRGFYHRASDFVYYDQTTCVPHIGRYMLLKSDPTLSDTMSMSTAFVDNENQFYFDDDLEHLLDIFKNDIDTVTLASTNTNDTSSDRVHRLSTDEFYTYE
jgi:hypothetical protein